MKNFVLDTNVLIHDPHALFKFEENTIVISAVVLKELDKLKSQDRAVSADARSVIRLLDSLVSDADPEELSGPGIVRNDQGGRLYIPKLELAEAGSDAKGESPDQQIISAALRINGTQSKSVNVDKDSNPSTSGPSIVDEADETVFVSRDLNARLIAKAAGVSAEDYFAAQIVKDTEHIQTGFYRVEDISRYFERWDKENADHGSYVLNRQALKDRLGIECNVNDVLCDSTHLYWIERIDSEFAYATPQDQNEKAGAFGIESTDIEQSAAMTALLNADIPLVSITGGAGSGKTLLSLAASLEQVMEAKQYRKIIVSRAAKDLDEPIGFLPGTEHEKVVPWLGAITDNLEVLMEDATDLESAVAQLERYIDYRSLNYMRGRSIQNAIVIIDEAQNLTSHQVKTLTTRVGSNSKMIMLGDLSQIDNPYVS